MTSNRSRSRCSSSGIVDLPMGLQLAPIVQYGSARPYNLTNSTNTINAGGGTALAVVVPNNDPTNWLAFAGDNVGAQNCYYLSKQCSIAKYDPLRGDSFFQLDMRLAKNIRLREGMNLQLIAQAFNLTNRANYGNNFSGDISTASTDPASNYFKHASGFINPSSTFTPRSIWSEFGVHFTF